MEDYVRFFDHTEASYNKTPETMKLRNMFLIIQD